jgi:hypothetical protein
VAGKGQNVERPARLPFEHALLTDESGRIVSAFAGEFTATNATGPSPSAVSLASRIALDGLLAPRSFVIHDTLGGCLLSVAGDRSEIHALYAQQPAPDQGLTLLRAIFDVEAAHAVHLASPTANPSVYASVPTRVARIFATNAPGSLKPPGAARVFVHATLEPRGPGVLVLLRVRNFTPEPVRGISIAFASPKEFLRPSALYGTGAAVDTSAVHLMEDLEPGEKLLELRLEPQEPHTGPFSVSLRGPGGLDVPARPMVVAVAFPKLSPPQKDPMMLAQQVVMREDDPRDVFRLRFTRAVSTEFAFERVKEAVARELPLKMMEYSSPAPAYHEAWFLSTVAPSQAPLLVEVAVRGPGRLIEVRAATRSLDDLLGVKAEYRRRIRELLSERFMGKKVMVLRSDALPPSIEEATPHLHSTLLLRHLQGEIGAGELWHEIRRTATGGSGEGWQFVAPFADELGPLEDKSDGGDHKALRPAHLVGMQSQRDLAGGIEESFQRIMAPIVLAQTARMGKPGARLRTGLDRESEAEAEAAED